MGRTIVHLVKNLNRKDCTHCGSVHEFFSRKSDKARCGTPLGMSEKMAQDMAIINGLDPDEAVIIAPDDTVIVLDDSARKLRQQGGAEAPMDQVFGIGTA